MRSIAFAANKISIEEDLVLADAGVAWSDFIEFCLQNNLYGIENLTHIPGSVGAAPVQNIGAYGVEISSFIESIFCFNLSSMQTETLHHDQCEFGYRDSIFKSKGYIILSVTFKLNKKLKELARKSVLSSQAKNQNITVLEDFNFEAPKTKSFLAIVESLELRDEKVLLVLTEQNKNIYLSSRNLEGVKVLTVNELNTYDLLNTNKVVLVESSVKELENTLS